MSDEYIHVPHTQENIEVTHLAETQYNDIAISELGELQSALIIQADSSEPAHFMQCIEERLCYYVRNPVVLRKEVDTNQFQQQTTFLKEQKTIFKKVDRVNESEFCNLTEQRMRSFLRDYNIIFFTLYAGTYHGYDPMVTQMINDLIDKGELAVVFLRGDSISVPMRLGFIDRSTTMNGFVEYSDGTYIQLLLENIHQLNNQNLQILLSKFKQLESRPNYLEDSNDSIIENCLSLNDTYICGVSERSLKKVADWHFLARSCTEREKLSWLVHKTKKVMFLPWYGFSHGNENQCLLCLYALRYLLLEHLKPFQSVKSFKANLWTKIHNNQLSDISIDSTIY